MIALFWVVGDSISVSLGLFLVPEQGKMRPCALSGQLEPCVHIVTADTLLVQVYMTLLAGDPWGSHMGTGHSLSRSATSAPFDFLAPPSPARAQETPVDYCP